LSQIQSGLVSDSDSLQMLSYSYDENGNISPIVDAKTGPSRNLT
jgi:hypothetical protein